MKSENISNQKSGRSIAIDFQMINIHTGWYVGSTHEFEAEFETEFEAESGTWSDQAARFWAHAGALAAGGIPRDLQIGFPERQPGHYSGRCWGHQGRTVLPLRQQGSLGVRRRRRGHRPRRPRQVGAPFAERQR